MPWRPNSTDNWHAYECYQCYQGDTGLVFDVRVPRRIGTEAVMAEVRCPLCSTLCSLKQSWPADGNGYGSRGDNGLTGMPRRVLIDMARDVVSDVGRELWRRARGGRSGA